MAAYLSQVEHPKGRAAVFCVLPSDLQCEVAHPDESELTHHSEVHQLTHCIDLRGRGGEGEGWGGGRCILLSTVHGVYYTHIQWFTETPHRKP